MTLYGQQQCEEMVRDLLKFNPLIVSGLALGVDVTAHLMALECGLKTMACLAHGLDQVHPKRHSKIAERILEQGGLCSETWTNGDFHKMFYIRRNRIIAGLSEATIVVESAAKGGSLTTADMAFSYDRLVYAVPGRLSDIQSVGCNKLIEKQLAQVYSSADVLARDLGWDESSQSDQLQLNLSIQEKLTVEEQKVFAALSSTSSIHLEKLRRQLQGLEKQLPSLLLSLELKGWVKPMPGQMFRRI